MQVLAPTYYESGTLEKASFFGVGGIVGQGGDGRPDPIDLTGGNIITGLLKWGKYIEANGSNSGITIEDVLANWPATSTKERWRSPAQGYGDNIRTGRSIFGDTSAEWVITKHYPFASNYNNTLGDVWPSQLSNGQHIIYMGIYGQQYHTIQIKTFDLNLFNYFSNYIGIK